MSSTGVGSRLREGLSRHRRVIAGACVVFAVAFVFHFATEFQVEPMLAWDGYVHTKIAYLYWTGECPIFGGDFPWMQFSIYNTMRHDWELLYHLALIPFTVFGLVTGGKLSAVLFASLFLATAYVVMRVHGVRWAWAFAVLLLFSSPALIWRWHLPRPTTLLLIFFLLLVHCVARKRALPTLVLSTICMWIYNIPQNLIALGGIGFLAHTVYDRRPPWKLTGALVAGLLLGVVLHPGFWIWDGSTVEVLPGISVPQNGTLQLWREVQQIVEVAANDGMMEIDGVQVRLALPGELLDVDTQALLREGGMTLALLCVTLLVVVLVPRRIPLIGMICLAMSCVYFYLTLRSIRFLEYWIPFTFLGCAFALRDLLDEAPVVGREPRIRMKDLWRRNLPTAMGGLLAAAVFVAVCGLGFHNARVAQGFLTEPSSRFGPLYEDAMKWLEANSEEGDLVFHPDWDDFAPMFFYNHKNYYMVGFLPNFFSMYDSQRFILWTRVGRGELDPASAAAAVRSFGARWILITHQTEWEQAFAKLYNAPGVEWVYRDDLCSIFEVRAGRPPRSR